MIGTVRLALLALAVTATEAAFRPIAYILPNPPPLLSALSPNYALYNAEKVHNNKLRQPASIAIINGNVYTVTNGYVVNSSPCRPVAVANLKPKGCRTLKQCGHLTSIRPDRLVAGSVLVLDAYRGVFRVNTNTGRVQQIMATDRPIGGRAPVFLNDFVQARDGTILISDSSDKYDIFNDIYILVEGRPGGRIISVNGTSGVTAEVLNELFVYPGGLELTADETGLLVAEAGRARILRVGLTSADWLKVTTFSVNLPGLPADIRRSSRNTFWVGLFNIRHRGAPSIMDQYAKNPAARLWSMQNVRASKMRDFFRKYGMIVELNAQGKIIGSLHDPTGRVASGVHEALEYDGLLYFVDKTKNFIGRIVLPQGDGRVITVNSAIQVLRSRCQIRENQLAQARQVLTQYINKRTNTTSSQAMHIIRQGLPPQQTAQQQGLQQQGLQQQGLQQQGLQQQGLQQQGLQQLGLQQQGLQQQGLQQQGLQQLGLQQQQPQYIATGVVQQQVGLAPAQPGLSAQIAALSQPGLGAQMAALSKAQLGAQNQISTTNLATVGGAAQPSIAEQIAALQAKQAAQQAQQAQLAQLSQQTQPGQLGQQGVQLTQQAQLAQLAQQVQQAQQLQQTQQINSNSIQQQNNLASLLNQPRAGVQAQSLAAQIAALNQPRVLSPAQPNPATQLAVLNQPGVQPSLANQISTLNQANAAPGLANQLATLQQQQIQAGPQSALAAQIAALQQQQNQVSPPPQSQTPLAAQLAALQQQQNLVQVGAQTLSPGQLSALQLGSQAQPQLAAQISTLQHQQGQVHAGAHAQQSELSAQIASLQQQQAQSSPQAQPGLAAHLASLQQQQGQVQAGAQAQSSGLAAQIAALQQQQQQQQAQSQTGTQVQPGLAAQLASLGQTAASSPHTSGQALYQKLSGAANPQSNFSG